MGWFWFLCLTMAAVSDVKERRVSCRLLILCGAAGMICGWKTGIINHAAGLLIGGIFLTVSRLTKGAIGSGDGWFLLASAGYFDTRELLILVVGSFGISWIWGIGIILYRIGTGGNAHKDTIPFLACMWPVGLWILIIMGEKLPAVGL